jgi:hypothetical protein
VGVYKKRGQSGSFLLILSEYVPGDWQKTFLATWPGKSAFLALSKNSNDIEVWDCMECESAGKVLWNGKTYFVDWSTAY